MNNAKDGKVRRTLATKARLSARRLKSIIQPEKTNYLGLLSDKGKPVREAGTQSRDFPPSGNPFG